MPVGEAIALPGYATGQNCPPPREIKLIVSRVFWPEGYLRGSLENVGKSYQNGDYLKQAMRLHFII